MPKILVTGGAGYIGSHTVLALLDKGCDVVVFDNLSTGSRDAVPDQARLIQGDLKDRQAVFSALEQERFDGIIHFAASIVVPESVANPLKYYANNMVSTTWLVEGALEFNVPKFIFSSTAAVYGDTTVSPLDENEPLAPTNPYGRSKLMNEWIIRDASTAHPKFRHAILRYFNVAGADPELRAGQSTPVATHLIKVAAQAALSRRDKLTVFGSDYPTPDGTCIRDYIHVSDLADVHVLALDHLDSGGESDIFNCGYGHGFSVREVVEAVKRIGGDFPVENGGRRAGDVPELVADVAKMRRAFHWTPRYDDLEFIVTTALEWEKRLVGKG